MVGGEFWVPVAQVRCGLIAPEQWAMWNQGGKGQCGPLPGHSCHFPKAVPESPWQSPSPYAPGVWGRKCLGLLRSWWGPLHLVVKPPELVTAARDTWSWNPPLRKERFRRRQAMLWALRRFPCVHLPWVHPHAERNQVGTDYLLWPDMWEIGDPLRITCTFSDLGDILITQKPPLDNKKNKCLSLHLFVSEESYILLCRYT